MIGQLDEIPVMMAGSVAEPRMEAFVDLFRIGSAELQAGRQSVAFELPRESFIMHTANLLLPVLGVALWSQQIAAAS